MEALKIEGLCLNFGGLQIFKNLHLTIEEGQFVAIIGPNGAGKTTLLNVIDGALSATAGHVYLFRDDITTMPTHSRAHRGLARSFQVTRLFFGLTVFDNILLALLGMKPSRFQALRPIGAYEEIISKGQQFLKRIDLWERKDELVGNLSYGEQRMLDVAVSLASEPKVLLLDEPTAGVAQGDIPYVVDAIKALTENTTALFSAHDMDVVSNLAKRVVALYFGEIIADGALGEVQANPKVIEVYLGTKAEQ